MGHDLHEEVILIYISSPMIRNKYLLMFISAVLGLLSIVAYPYLVLGEEAAKYGSPLLITVGMENMDIKVSVGLFFSIGFLLSILNPEKWIWISISTISFLVIGVVIEIVASPGSHNLLFFEIIIYLTFSASALVGAYLGKTFCLQLGRC